MKRALSPIQRAAEERGIQVSYFDNTGREQLASDETLRTLLEKLGGSAAEGNRPALEPVTVLWQKGRAKSRVQVRMDREQLRRARMVLAPRDGSGEMELKARVVPSKRSGETTLELPPLPTGYYNLRIESGRIHTDTLLISAPVKFYATGAKRWGGFLPLYANHSKESWGAGNFTDWEQLAGWLADQGAKVIGTLPLMAAFLDKPVCEPSPYSPATRLFWNEFFIDITRIPEFQSSARAQRVVAGASFANELKRFRESELIDYQAQWRARRKVLELLAAEFFQSDTFRRRRFEQFVRERPEAEDYARFRAACDRYGVNWQQWPGSARQGKLGARDYSEATLNLYRYAQWIAQEQIAAVLGACRSKEIQFYLDLPLGVNPDGYDAWRYREFFAQEVSAGAPPDSFFTKGQDWGFAPLCPVRSRELQYRYVIDYLRFQMRHTGLLRIDHVMGLHRLWWVPRGSPASAGAYVRYRAEELYAILSVESHLHQTTLVGENLGTVPPEVNESMDRHGLRRMYVLQYEQQPEAPPRDPVRQEVASVNTHDMPPFAAFWKGLDIADRQDLGLIANRELPAQKKTRARMRQALIAALRKEKLLSGKTADVRAVLEGVLRFLARSDAETVLLNLEDLWGETRSQNVPGTSTERPNWRRKSRLSLEEIRTSARIAAILRRIQMER